MFPSEWIVNSAAHRLSKQHPFQQHYLWWRPK
jgi:hypothetical protein